MNDKLKFDYSYVENGRHRISKKELELNFHGWEDRIFLAVIILHE